MRVCDLLDRATRHMSLALASLRDALQYSGAGDEAGMLRALGMMAIASNAAMFDARDAACGMLASATPARETLSAWLTVAVAMGMTDDVRVAMADAVCAGDEAAEAEAVGRAMLAARAHATMAGVDMEDRP